METTLADVSLAAVCFGGRVKSGQMDLGSFLDEAVLRGLGAVELCDRTIRDPRQVAAMLSRRGLAMPSVALRNDFTVPADQLAGQLDHLRRWLPTVAELGGEVARIWTGLGTGARAREQVVASLDALLPEAAAAGVVLAVETHGGLSNHPEFMAQLCARYSGEPFGVCLDFGNLPADGRRAAISRLAPMTVHVHVKTYEFRDGVETSVPVEWAIGELERVGYRGQWVLEYEGEPPYGMGIDLTLAALCAGRPVAQAAAQ